MNQTRDTSASEFGGCRRCAELLQEVSQPLPYLAAARPAGEKPGRIRRATTQLRAGRLRIAGLMARCWQGPAGSLDAVARAMQGIRVGLRCFAGLKQAEVAGKLGIFRSTADRPETAAPRWSLVQDRPRPPVFQAWNARRGDFGHCGPGSV
jgi:hypothetical protein